MHVRLAAGMSCPFSQATKIALLHLKVPHETRFVDAGAPPDWLVQEVPGGQVPALWHEEAVVWESLAICDLVDRLVDGALWPRAPVERAQAWAWASLAAGMLERWHSMARGDEKAGRALARALAPLEVAIGYGPFFQGPRLGIVDVAFAPLWLRLEMHGWDEVLEDLPRVRAWAGHVVALEEVQGAMPAEWREAVAHASGLAAHGLHRKPLDAQRLR